MARSHIKGLRKYHAIRLGLSESKLKKRGTPARKKLADLMRKDWKASKG